MSSATASLAVSIDTFLDNHATWNNKRSQARISIFSTPLCLLHRFDGGSDMMVNANNGDNEEESICASSSNNGLTCRTCMLVFDSLTSQRSHFKSTIHTINLRRKGQGLSPLEESQISANGDIITNQDQVGDQDNCDSDDSADGIDGIDEIVCTDIKPVTGTSAEGAYSRTVSGTTGPMCAFRPVHQPNWEFICSDVLLSVPNQLMKEDEVADPSPWNMLLRGYCYLRDSSRLWAVLVLRSGKFAGAVFDGDSVILHKVFRRYTIRAKSGGSQSSHDNAHGKAASAGAMMRRQGEVMLKEDISSLLKDWQTQLQNCFLILTSCPKTMRNVLFEEDVREPVLKKGDKRIRSIPFMVSTPTFEEVLNIRDRCTNIIFRKYHSEALISTVTEFSLVDSELCKDMPAADIVSYKFDSDVLSAQTIEEGATACFTDAAAELIQDTKPIDEVEAINAHDLFRWSTCPFSTKIFAALSNQDSEQLARIILDINRLIFVRESLAAEEDKSASTGQFLDCTGIEDIQEWDLSEIVNMPSGIDVMETPLHRAAALGLADAVALLLENSADPTRIDVRGRVPYMLSKDKPTRDAFRKARAADEEGWDWTAAAVPRALTAEMEKAQKDREREKKKKAKAKKKEQKAKEEEAEENAAKLLQEQQEQAKRDEEARQLHILVSAGVCASCGVSLFQIPSIPVIDNQRCCSNTCVIRFKRKLAADAALERIRQKKETS